MRWRNTYTTASIGSRHAKGSGRAAIARLWEECYHVPAKVYHATKLGLVCFILADDCPFADHDADEGKRHINRLSVLRHDNSLSCDVEAKAHE